MKKHKRKRTADNDPLSRWGMVAVSKERARQRNNMINEALDFMEGQKRKGWNLIEILAQVETGYPNIVYADICYLLYNKLK